MTTIQLTSSAGYRQPYLQVLTPGDLPALPLNPEQIECLKVFRKALERGEMNMHEARCISGTTATEAHLIACRDRYGLDIGTYLCPETGLMWTSPIFDPESVAVFYHDYYRWMYTGSPTPDEKFAMKQQEHGRQILAFVKSEISNGLVFDVGCGVGATVMPFKKAGWSTCGCDYGEEFIKKGRELGLDLHVGNFASLHSSGPCDLLIGSHVLEHTLDPLRELRGWGELIRDGAYFYIEVPGIFQAYVDYRNFARFLHIAHTYHFTLESLQACLAPLGFELVKGDESVRALFRKVGKHVAIPDTSQLANRILKFLDRQETPSATVFRRMRRQINKLVRSVKKCALF